MRKKGIWIPKLWDANQSGQQIIERVGREAKDGDEQNTQQRFVQTFGGCWGVGGGMKWSGSQAERGGTNE